MPYHMEVFFEKELFFAIWQERNIYFLPVFRQGKLLALYTKSARGWYLTLCFDSKNIYPHIFYIVYHCSPCLVHQTSAYSHDANQLTETVSGGLTHCVRGQRSVVPWRDACTDWKPTPCRWPAAVLRLGFGCEVPIRQQFHLPSKEHPLPIGYELRETDGMERTARARSMLPVWVSSGSNRINGWYFLRVSNRTDTLKVRICCHLSSWDLYSSKHVESTFQAADITYMRQ